MNKTTWILLSSLAWFACAAPARDEAPIVPAPEALQIEPVSRFVWPKPQAPRPQVASVTVNHEVASWQPKPATLVPRAKTDAALDRALRAELRATRIYGLKFVGEESLKVVIRAISQQTGLPLIVHPSAENAALDAGVVYDLDFEHRISVHDALNLITRHAGEEVSWIVRHEAVIVTTKAKAQSRLALQLHDIRPLTFDRVDFIAPRLDRIRLIDELEDDDGGGPFGGIGEVTRQIEEEDLATLVQENIAVGTWENDGISIEAANGFLIVRQTAEVQVQIARFLETMAF